MGISGLLPLLKSIQRPTELKKFAGETFAVDAYGWLHRGTVSCAIELAQGKPTRKYVDFAMHRVRMLKYFGVTPYVVFDGDFLPSKAQTEMSRAKRREESKRVGLELLKAGKPSQAHQELQKAVDVTPEMARNLIEELKNAGIPYVVAPYEADAQMVYLERHGYVTGIVSEDSDLLVFGAKRLLTKLDQHGQCIEINRRDFCACREISLTGWTDKEFRHMAILSGCDYLDGIGNLGLKTAYRMIRKHKTPEKVVRMLQFDGKFRVSENYLTGFKQAELTFLHQRVFCPKAGELVMLTEPDPGSDVGEMPFIGGRVDGKMARAIALGDVNPITKEPIVLPSLPGRGNTKHGATTANTARSQPVGKPIESYFKSHNRIPMGEMDPNCFAVDPSKVAARSQNGLTPRVFPLPRPYLDAANISPSSGAARPYIAQRQRRRTEPVTNLLATSGSWSQSSTRRRTAVPMVRDSDEMDNRETAASARPAKKARLCDDVEVHGSPNREPVRSKFFPVGKSTPRPSRVDQPLMSDDSIEEALLSLPDVDNWGSSTSNRTAQSLDIFQDETQITQPDSPKPASLSAKDDDSSIRDDVEAAASGENEKTSGTAVMVSLKQFSYTPAMPRTGTRFANGLPTPESGSQISASDSTAPTTATPLMTPLQRIGAQALDRGKGIGTPRQGAPPSGGSAKRSMAKPRTPKFPVNPAFVPLPRVDLAEVEALNDALGSEDQIIPDSDAENEADQPDDPDAKNPHGFLARRQLNLSRFLYS